MKEKEGNIAYFSESEIFLSVYTGAISSCTAGSKVTTISVAWSKYVDYFPPPLPPARMGCKQLEGFTLCSFHQFPVHLALLFKIQLTLFKQDSCFSNSNEFSQQRKSN